MRSRWLFLKTHLPLTARNEVRLFKAHAASDA